MSGERQRAQQEVLLSCLAFLLLFLFYMTCAIKLPIVSAAHLCCCRVAWV